MHLRARSSSTVLRLYPEDFDLNGLVHHSRYLLLVERALVDLWEELGYPAGDDDLRQYLRVILADYHSPVTWRRELIVDLWTVRVGRTSVTYGFAIHSGDPEQPHVSGKRVAVKVNQATGRPVPWGDRMREDLLSLTRFPIGANDDR